MLKTMTDRYNALAFTHNYIFGFTDRGVVYAVITDSSVLPYALTLDHASSKNGGGYSVRFSPNKAQKEMLKTAGKLIAVCSEDQFNEMVKTSKYNTLCYTIYKLKSKRHGGRSRREKRKKWKILPCSRP